MGIGINLNRASVDELVVLLEANISSLLLLLSACMLIAIVLTALATYIPARRASKLSPAEALRYEN